MCWIAGPQTLNNGVVLLRNSVRGHFFLELLLEKAWDSPDTFKSLLHLDGLLQALWFQTIERDQGPFDETVLEVLGMEASSSHPRNIYPCQEDKHHSASVSSALHSCRGSNAAWRLSTQCGVDSHCATFRLAAPTLSLERQQA